MTSALLWIAAVGWLAAAALGLGASRRYFLRVAGSVSSAAGVACLVGGVRLALSGHATATVRSAADVVGGFDVRATPLASAFVVLLGVITLAIGLYAPRYHHASKGTAIYLCVYNLAALASLAVLVSGEIVTFLVAWESMTIASSLVILRYHHRDGVSQGTFLFLALGEVGFVMVIAAFAILATQTHSLEFSVIAAHANAVPFGWKSLAFVLALLGFGFKAGLVPMHVWLPAAHPVAPADGSAFLSGMIIKLGVYGIMLFAFVLLGPGPRWWGILVMALGALSAIVGILYAIAERDLKRFLAYSSVENVGIIVTVVGAAMTFSANHQPILGAFLLLVALYHVVNHGCYKTLLFLEAGVIEHATGTRDLDDLGGLVRRMRATSIFSLIGVLGIAALPPLNGFVSEWLVFEGLFQGFRVNNHVIGILILVAAAVLGLTAGLAVFAFARAFGIGYLGMPRSHKAAVAQETGQPILGPGLLAAACLALALGAPAVLSALDHVVRSVTGVQLRPVLLVSNLAVIPGHKNFAAFSPTYLAVFLVAVSIVPLAIFALGRPRGRSRQVPVWDGGIRSYTAANQYSATTFANPERVTFERFYHPNVEIDRASDDPAGRSGPVHYRWKVLPFFETYLYRPIARAAQSLARRLQPIQSGDINQYLLYILVVLVVILLVYAW
jgi:hydrogenase-4 component B